MYMSQYHKGSKIINTREVVCTVINTKENKDFLTQQLMAHFQNRFNNYDDPIMMDIIRNVESVCERFYEHVLPAKHYPNAYEHISDINIKIFNYIVSIIKPYQLRIDPLWSQKGPGYKEELIGLNRHPLMKVGTFGPTYNTPQSGRTLISFKTSCQRKRIEPRDLL